MSYKLYRKQRFMCEFKEALKNRPLSDGLFKEKKCRDITGATEGVIIGKTARSAVEKEIRVSILSFW